MRWMSLAIAFSAVVFTVVSVQADVKPAPIFSEHAVLQRDMKLPVWGKADAGEEVTVSINGQSVKTVTGADGVWQLVLEPLKAGGPYEMTITGKNSLDFKDILVGEVWFCGGQSNMQFGLKASLPKVDLTSIHDPELRMCRIAGKVLREPTRDFQAAWVPAVDPQVVGNWTAVGYFAGAELRKKLNVPVGLMDTSMGWTVAEGWTSRESMTAVPELKPIVDRWDMWYAAAPNAKKLYDTAHAQWVKDAAEAKTAGTAIPPEPPVPADPLFMHCAAGLYNGMIAPLMPCAIRGVFWYQGETNSPRADQYRKLFPVLIQTWRKNWGQGDFPFIYVQIAPLEVHDQSRVELRDAQREALSQPNTAMICISDHGLPTDEHPPAKEPVGQRVAMAAMALAYGDKTEYMGPIYKNAVVEGSTMRVSFTHIGSGLLAKDGELVNFTLAGEDKKWKPASAKIDGQTIVVSSPDVPQPVAVRYNWADFPVPMGNLFNVEGLPASTFRSDNWDLVTKGHWKMFYEEMNLDEVTMTPKPAKPAGK